MELHVSRRKRRERAAQRISWALIGVASVTVPG